jgi:Rap1a immunity proteins
MILLPPQIKMLGVLLTIGLLSLSLPAWSIADNGDGNKLLSDCGPLIAFLDGESVDQDKSRGISFCLGLIQGMLHMNQFYEYQLKGAALFCAPNSMTNGQATRIVVKYLRDHPEELHQPDSVLTFTALRAAFPCGK